MNELTGLLYWISTGLLIPVIIVLLFFFIRILLSAGGFISQFIQRLNYDKTLNTWLKAKNYENVPDSIQKQNAFLYPFLVDITQPLKQTSEREKTISDFEIEADKELSKVKMPARLGPMLGLMGTLIPMGPALVGLASGDIAGMAQNMQVAFSTTVVGIVIGALGFVLQLIKTRWFAQDVSTLEFLADYQTESTKDEK
ncbi:MotA/TolQ/ExbB proton channel family protein [bacterium]|nr:MAG: MotA/TolQ/ExbB proton channel family protein [bacterium]